MAACLEDSLRRPQISAGDSVGRETIGGLRLRGRGEEEWGRKAREARGGDQLSFLSWRSPVLAFDMKAARVGWAAGRCVQWVERVHARGVRAHVGVACEAHPLCGMKLIRPHDAVSVARAWSSSLSLMPHFLLFDLCVFDFEFEEVVLEGFTDNE